jgi:hypothetical protein
MTLDETLNAVPRTRNKQCRLNIWLATLTEDDRNAFWRAMDNDTLNKSTQYA